MAEQLIIRPGHPDFLELPWDRSIVEWDVDNLLDLPKDISRHEVRFLNYEQGVYVVKELPTAAARNEYRTLRELESRRAPAVRSAGLVESRMGDDGHEAAAALITEYEQFSFSYRQLLAGAGFGPRRNQMLDAFPGLLVELHVAGCFWGDCSLSNVLYRFDAGAIEAIMVDAETSQLHGTLSDGQRRQDIEIMKENVAGVWPRRRAMSVRAKHSRMPAHARRYVAAFARGVEPIWLWSTRITSATRSAPSMPALGPGTPTDWPRRFLSVR